MVQVGKFGLIVAQNYEAYILGISSKDFFPTSEHDRGQ